MSLPKRVEGTFHLTNAQYHALESRLAEFREKAVPRTAANLEAMLNARCPSGERYTIDAGEVFVRWAGQGFDELYVAHLGCNDERDRAENERLVQLFDDLPVPRR